MFTDSIKLTCSGEEKSRRERLQRVIGYVYALASRSGNGDFLDKIDSLDDHEGQLTVKWKSAPTDDEKELFSKAWESSIGDGAPNVDHEM
ncbi:MAG: hypothetical protein WCV56_06470 [Candidatus Omnitrophota bacterium]